MIDFSVPEARQAMEAAITRVRGELGREYPLIIGGQPIWTQERLRSINPSETSEAGGQVAKASRREAEQALEAAWAAFPAWSGLPAPARASALFKAAAIMPRRKLEPVARRVVGAAQAW